MHDLSDPFPSLHYLPVIYLVRPPPPSPPRCAHPPSVLWETRPEWGSYGWELLDGGIDVPVAAPTDPPWPLHRDPRVYFYP